MDSQVDDRLRTAAWQALKAVPCPVYGWDIVSSGVVASLAIHQARAEIVLDIDTLPEEVSREIARQARRALGDVRGLASVECRCSPSIR